MPKRADLLTDKKVRTLTTTGGYSVGGCVGLNLQVTDTGARSWILRYRSPLTGKRREHGLGPYPEVSLAAARTRGAELVSAIRAGADPVEDRRAARAEIKERAVRATTLSEVIDKFIAADKLASLSQEKNRRQWKASMDLYILPALGARPVSEITLHEVHDTLCTLWKTKPETGSRIRARLESVFAFAIVSGLRQSANPAIWKGGLEALLPRPSDVRDVGNQPNLDSPDAPRWFAALKAAGGEAARALELVTLTACRSGEIRKLVWGEVDLAKRAIAIPAAKMKMKRDHRVPLTDAAVAVLEAAKQRCEDRGLATEAEDLVFPAPRGGTMSDMTLSATMKRMHEKQVETDGKGWIDPVSKRPAVPHGLRATFRTWAQDHTEFPREMAEAALAHVVRGTEGTYARGDQFKKRGDMMQAWAAFLIDPEGSQPGV
ncbi:MAG: integrase [Rhodovulum sulfidophilum]|uniref:Integrase n=1 Tax=Rhodovulum sulfidophilum TaxID=35806 RepID=A0A2W5Q3A9_RHOSU|nr:MAG: integrase [Rhodovulum sulfidophilum]